METRLNDCFIGSRTKFKSYYVVWKQALSEEIEADEDGLNRTM